MLELCAQCGDALGPNLDQFLHGRNAFIDQTDLTSHGGFIISPGLATFEGSTVTICVINTSFHHVILNVGSLTRKLILFHLGIMLSMRLVSCRGGIYTTARRIFGMI